MASARILIIDDNAGALRALASLLRDEGFVVIAAADGISALEGLESAAPDLVLTDLHMPGMSGLDLLSVVRKRAPDVPVILMTSDSTPENMSCARERGAAEFLAKPLHVDTVTRVLWDTLGR